MITHKQCLLNKSGAQQKTWIPTEFASVGSYVKLKENGAWTDGWRVDEVYDPAIASEVIQERAADHRSHRRATDI